MAKTVIPIVDLNDLASSPKEASSLEFTNALRKHGIMYIRNHGIPQELILNAFTTYKTFFNLPRSTKTLYSRATITENRKGGYYTFEGKGVDNQPPSFMESFHISDTEIMDWPYDVQQMKENSEDIQAAFIRLAVRVFKLLSTGLKQPADTFTSMHSKRDIMWTSANYYPALTQEDFEEGQMRLLTHADWTTITLLIPDSDGLEAKLVGSDTYTQVPFVPDTVLVLVGEILQRLTNDQFVAVEHRVPIPTLSEDRKKIRQSFACFLFPDMDVLIPEVHVSEKYPRIKTIKFINEKISIYFPDLKLG